MKLEISTRFQETLAFTVCIRLLGKRIVWAIIFDMNLEGSRCLEFLNEEMRNEVKNIYLKNSDGDIFQQD